MTFGDNSTIANCWLHRCKRFLFPSRCTWFAAACLLSDFTIYQHYLRGESGVYYQDLYPLICFLPRYANGGSTERDLLPMWHASEDGEYPLEHNPQRAAGTRSNSSHTMDSNYKEETSSTFFGSLRKHNKVFDPEKVLPVVDVHRPLKPSRNPPRAGFTDYFPFLKIFKLIAKPFRKSPGIHLNPSFRLQVHVSTFSFQVAKMLICAQSLERSVSLDLVTAMYQWKFHFS